MNTPKYIIVHSTGTTSTKCLSLADIERQHRAQGCLNIKHHFVIQRDGLLCAGRGLDQIGLHANRKYNSCSIGILMVGGDGSAWGTGGNFTVPQMDTLKVALQALVERYPDAQVVGWRDLSDNPAETSPDFDVAQWWDQQ